MRGDGSGHHPCHPPVAGLSKGGEPSLESVAGKRGARGEVEAIKAVEENNCKFTKRSALGLRWGRMMKDAKFKAQFEAAPDAAKFKADWVKEIYDGAVRKHRTHTKEVSETWMNQGKLLTFLRMCWEEGGPTGHKDRQIVKDIMTTCGKCIDLGWPFCQVDPWSGAQKYLYFELQYREEFMEKWSETTCQEHEKNAVADSQPTEKPKPTPKKKAPDESAAALRDSKKLVVMAQSALAAARSLRRTIETSGGWEWAMTDAVQGKLKTMSGKLEREIKA
eukprot:3196028-Pyramimonas_sp.AAC.1